MGERVIKFRDLTWYIVSRWRIIVIFIILGAILFVGYDYSKTSAGNDSSVKMALIDPDETDESELLKSVKGLSTEDGVKALAGILSESDYDAINVYNEYTKLYNKQNDSAYNLELMSLDPYNSYEGRYLYSVKSPSVELLAPVLAVYKARLKELKDNYGSLVNTSTDTNFPPFLVINGEESESVAMPVGTITVSIYGATKEDCKNKLDSIDKFIEEISHESSNGVADCEVKAITKGFYNFHDSAIMDLQKGYIDTLSSLNTSANNVYKTMTDKAKAFVDYINSNQDLVLEDVLASLNKNELQNIEPVSISRQPSTNSGSFTVSSKSVLLGLLIGFIFAVIVLAIYYSMSDKMRFEEDIETQLKIPCFSLVTSNKKMFVLDRIIKKARYKNTNIVSPDHAPDIIASNIKVCADRKNVNSVYATGTLFSSSNKDLAERVKEILKDKGLNMIIGEQLFYNAEEIERMCKIGVNILFESMHSKNNDVYKAIRTCNDRGVDTLGIVLGE